MEWRGADCPRRGVGLSHMDDMGTGRCTHCEVPLTYVEPPKPTTPVVPIVREVYHGDQCPMRTRGMPHYERATARGTCDFCGQNITDERVGPNVPSTATQASVEPVNVVERLVTMGLILPDALKDSERGDIMVEPRMITGDGPTGKDWKVGRGPLTARQKDIVVARVGWGQYLSEHGGGELR
jgi:hypothetical protein